MEGEWCTTRRFGGAYVISPRLRSQTNELFLRTAAAAVELVILSSFRAALKVVLCASAPFRVLVAQSHSPLIRDPRQLRHGKQNKKRGKDACRGQHLCGNAETLVQPLGCLYGVLRGFGNRRGFGVVWWYMARRQASWSSKRFTLRSGDGFWVGPPTVRHVRAPPRNPVFVSDLLCCHVRWQKTGHAEHGHGFRDPIA